MGVHLRSSLSVPSPVLMIIIATGSIVFVVPLSELKIDPTQGFMDLPLNESNFHFQKPCELPVTDRYSFVDDVHKLLVYSTDSPLSEGSPTRPRTEIMFSGVWQFEGHGYVPNGTSSDCVMQVFRTHFPRNTTFMIGVYNGSLHYYQSALLVPNMYDRWFRLNVVHDVNALDVKVYIDGDLNYIALSQGGTLHYFKCGVYAQNNASYYTESRWIGIRVLKKID